VCIYIYKKICLQVYLLKAARHLGKMPGARRTNEVQRSRQHPERLQNPTPKHALESQCPGDFSTGGKCQNNFSPRKASPSPSYPRARGRFLSISKAAHFLRALYLPSYGGINPLHRISPPAMIPGVSAMDAHFGAASVPPPLISHTGAVCNNS